MKKRIGYKAMNQDMTCKHFQYEIGKTYKCEGEIKPCKKGFHFCKNIFNTLGYYSNIKGDKRFFKIQYDKCINSDDKSVTNKINILEEVNLLDFINDSMSEKDWFFVSASQKLSEEFIRKFKDKVCWDGVSQCQKLSEEFIREFQDKVVWCLISAAQKLSESFIQEFQNKVNWRLISRYQTLSDSFKEEFKDRLTK